MPEEPDRPESRARKNPKMPQSREENPLSVRWVVLWTGTKATEDYQPAASEGVSDELLREATNMGVAFHPHTEIRLFPANAEGALLFWKARTTGDHVVTRVALAPNPQGIRAALEYVSAVLSPDEFARWGGDPFAVASSGLLEQIRAQFLEARREPVTFSPPPTVAVSAAAPEMPPVGGESSPETIAALRAYCAAVSGTKDAPTFATWWASGGKTAPPGYFAVILSAPTPQALSLRDAGIEANALAAEIKGSLPSAPAGDTVAGETARGLLAGADAFAAGIEGASARLNDEAQDRFRERLGEAARAAARMESDLAAYARRISSGGSSDNHAGQGSAALLAQWGSRYENLARELPGVRHPNPFAGTHAVSSPSAASLAGNRPSSDGAPNAKVGMIAAGVAVVALLSFVASQFVGGGAKKPAPAPAATPAAIARVKTPSATVAAPPSPHPAVPAPKPSSVPKVAVVAPSAAAASKPPAANLLLAANQAKVLSDAKSRARDDARTAATEAAGRNSELSETAIERITVNAIKGAYKSALSSAQNDTVFGGDKSGSSAWTYQRFTQAAPTLTPAVHEAALVAATEAIAAHRVAAADTTKAGSTEARPQPTPEATPRLSRPRPTPAPPKATPRPKPAAPKAGSVDQTGL